MGTDSGAARTLLDGAATLHLHTGNLMNWGRLKKKCAVSPSEEGTLQCTLWKTGTAVPTLRKIAKKAALNSRGISKYTRMCHDLGTGNHKP
ncbi:unnamed protein product [Ranitomeya imitator]|uniref:Uncharacterized protein n=1 Tax=Ranitomeya imitator TaxID=111125 RepID=A0ABN9L696_9NEOB|nr:unnamed protein product [Ranitomeya imitator]